MSRFLKKQITMEGVKRYLFSYVGGSYNDCIIQVVIRDKGRLKEKIMAFNGLFFPRRINIPKEKRA